MKCIDQQDGGGRVIKAASYYENSNANLFLYPYCGWLVLLEDYARATSSNMHTSAPKLKNLAFGWQDAKLRINI
jgi:hypothetical protein